MTVLVCGATGTTGREVVRQLRAIGVPVRALTRSDDAASRLRSGGVDAVVGDLGDPPSLAAALDGVDAVFVASPASPRIAELEGDLAVAATSAGVGHLVKLSVIGCSPESPFMFGRLHYDAERAVIESGIAWTMVRPNGFMQDTLAWSGQIRDGVVRLPVVDARWSIVDVRDIAAVAVAALTDPAAHAGVAYTVTGPEATSPREQVAILGQVLERELVAEAVTIEEAKESMTASGVPEWTAERLGELLALYADGLAAKTSRAVQRLTGRPPRSYRQFALDHRDAFAPAPG